MSRGSQITLRKLAIDQYKREYKRKDYSDEKLKKVRDHLDGYTPDSYTQAREHELRIKAINQLLDNEPQ